MPKDFLQPMTCFYWATQGRCTKTADECFYAHWDTGVIASAPVSMARDGQSVTVAGRHADAQIADFIARENSLKTRELALNSRQVLLNQHDAALNARCANMKTAMQEVYDTIETFDNESAEALRALHRRKKQIEDFNVATATEGKPSEYGAMLLFAVNGSIGAVTKMAQRVDEVGNYMKEHIGINAVHEASVAAFVQANNHV
ncbi:hypothetical protein B0A49_07660 [Cryomyces minteri]|uniref:C3H1-type domain-containing protein n=1 Tax=Cryomyces minteri TaxID=331657 RepID=A0A4U0WYM3_9PEZI|nr:hypothetical protein B0A49_07660 [Cryomyces minteri]